ncbi:hypothetical protein [Deinococcus budaensis]|uniref:Phage-related tail fiber protein n=1 Tax=Deinococcus budaensis TaxID=1665626 RepID=A0A7W8GFZ0_9DEIO|nr:hypothetical protein [Deinococcus budaensis]MBB5234496.1 phage-related tail fiber protein [Deinococcus budaensis]
MSIKRWKDLDMQAANRILNLPAAVAAGQPVTFEQLQSLLEGLAFKDNVRVATQANLNLASPGANIDGVAMAANDRVLVKAQTVQTENGVYLWTGAASAMVRAADASTFDELESAIVTVDEGTDAGKTFRQTQVNGAIGTNNVVWASFGTGASQATETLSGIAEIATQAETDGGADDLRFITALKLKTSVWAARGFTVLFGDGSATQYDLSHLLGGEVQVSVYEVATGEYADVRKRRVDANTIRINATPAPATNSMRAVVSRIGG